VRLSTTEPGTTPRRARLGPLLIVGTVLACLVAIGLVALTGTDYAAAGIRGPDSFTRNGLIVIRVLAEISGVLCVGSLLFAAFMVPPQESGVLSVDGYPALRTASWAAAAWCVSALLSVPFTVADAFAEPVSEVGPARLLDLVFTLEQTKAWMLTAAVAFLLAVAAARVLMWRSTPVLLLVAVLGLVPVASSGHSSSGGDHDWATASLLWHLVAAALWVGGLVALLAYGRRKGEHLGLAASRFSQVALVCWIAMAVSGVINALVRLQVANLFSTAYGLLTVAKIAALAGLGAFGYLQRRRGVRDVTETGSGRALVRLAAFEILLMLVTIGLATALGRTPPPDHGSTDPSSVELKIGYGLDGPPSLARAFVDWRFDLILGTAALALAAVYLLGVRRLRAQGEPWPVARTIAWLGGCAEVLLATSSGIGRYAPAVFSIDMVSNMFLSILAPILLVLGNPVTLAQKTLRTGTHPGPRQWFTAWRKAPAVRFLAHPAVVVVLFVGSFYALYFSGLFDWSLDVPLAHVGMNAYFLITGFVFFWAVVGTDPFPRQLSLRHRKAMVFTAVPVHALFGITLLSSDTVVGDRFYRTLGLPWAADLLGIQRLGGTVAWGAGVVPLFIVALALLVPWSKLDSKEPEPAAVR
jgi:cytochrome c oxidase assembly factor CtaG/putative copper export protein